ncbi:MAG: hypothetical protein O7C98_02845, partial [Planctomycetota bacterium]|nr:hypothetical protein [Planctomycetota bacterium]
MRFIGLFSACLFAISCGGGSPGTSGDFQQIEFLTAGQDNIERNTRLRFVFSEPVAAGQNLPERIRIENIQTGGAVPNFSLAVGDPRIGESLPGAADGKGYDLNGNVVDFYPKLPELTDASDAGFRPGGEYHVFLKSGPDSLRSTTGSVLPFQQESIFNTNDFFADPFPLVPPRALGLTATEAGGGSTGLSRLDPVSSTNRGLGNAVLLQQGRIINPGTGTHPYQTINPDGSVDPNRWEILLEVSEPLSPASVTTDMITLTQIREDALDANNMTVGAFANTAVSHEVPLEVEVRQSFTSTGFAAFIVVRPLHVLVDDARYRLEFDGSILGIDARKTFIGDNGLTGDGASGAFRQETAIATAGQVLFPLGQLQLNESTLRAFVNSVEQVLGIDYLVVTAPAPGVAFTGAPGAGASVLITYNGGTPVSEVGGRGYEAEFLVFDRAVIPSERNLTFDPLVDGVNPETTDPARINTSLYNPATDPGKTVGFLAAFGTGKDGPLSVPNGGVT